MADITEEKKEKKNAWQREYAKTAGREKREKYMKEHSKSVAFRLFLPQDNDMALFLETKENKAGYIKDLIRADIEKNKP